MWSKRKRMCHYFVEDLPTLFDKSNFRVLKIYLYKVYFENSKVKHDKDLYRRLVKCNTCNSLFVQQIANDIRYIEVKDEKEAGKLAKKLPDNNFVSNKHNMIIVDADGGITYLRKGR